MQPIKLHLGSGPRIIPGYVNVDIQNFSGVDLICDLGALPFADASIDFIYSCSVIEHFMKKEWQDILAHWYAMLKPGATLRLSTVDFEAVCIQYLEAKNIEELLGLVTGGQKDPYDHHGMIFDFQLLKKGLEAVGFVDVRRYDWRETDYGRMGIDDFSQAYLPHMDKENGRLMMVNVEAEKHT